MGLKAAALRIFVLFVRAAYSVFRLVRRRRNEVVFLSRQSDRPSPGFTALLDELVKLDPELGYKFSCRLGLRSEMGLSYIPLLIKQLWMLAGARACVTESYVPPVSIPKSHGSTRTVQIWHSPVAIKRFGWQTVGLPEGSDRATAEIMRMHAGYDAVICGSEYQRRFFAEAMRTPIEKVLPLGSADADKLMEAAKNRGAHRAGLLRTHPEAEGKRLIAYLPTMRRGYAVPWQPLADALGGGCVLFIGLHPLDRHTPREGSGPVIIDGRLSSRQLMLACDAVISDYSGAAAEAAICGVDLYFYVPDIDEYSTDCGLNTDPREVFPEITACTPEEMARLLSSPCPARQKERVRELLAGGCDGKSASKIAEAILEIGN